MALTDNENDASYSPGVGLKNINPDAPDFVKDIRVNKAQAPLNMSVEFIPQNPYEISIPGNLGSPKEIKSVQEKPGFFKVAGAEAYNLNITAEALHASFDVAPNPLDDIPPQDWTPKTDTNKFINIEPQNLNYVFGATGPKDQDYRIQRVMAEQAHDETLANGSWFAKLVGGVAGIATDPMSYVPILGWAKYAKFAPTFLKSAARAFPGMAAYGVTSSAVEQMDKVNGNMTDFITDSFTRTVFGSVLFGGLGAAGLTLEHMKLWNAQKLANSVIDGAGFKFAVDESGKVNGITAFDKSGGLSADKVTFAQDIANSSFSESGVFAVPYLGKSLQTLFTLPILGTPLPKLLNSTFKTVRAFTDRVVDHSIITTGIKEGQVAPKKFATLMNQNYANLRSLEAQMSSMHLERNGFTIQNRALGGLYNLGLNLKDKSLELLNKDLNRTGYVSREAFDSEIEEVIRTEQQSAHSSVNEAASMMRKQMDDVYRSYREAYNLPETWLPPKTAQAYLMRVYDTPFLNSNEKLWVDTISNWLKDADVVINNRMEPINELEKKIKEFKETHNQAFIELGKREVQLEPSRAIAYPEEQGVSIRQFVEPTGKKGKKAKGERDTKLIPYADIMQEYNGMRNKLSAMKDTLQNELRNNPELQLHVDDWNALSADESKELKTLLKPQNDLLKQIDEQKKVISDLKKKKSAKLTTTKKQKTVESAKPHAKEVIEKQEGVEEAESKLQELQNKHQEEYDRIQESAHKGELNPRFYKQKPGEFSYEFKDPNERLKFRETYGTGEGKVTPETHAKAYYDTIMGQTPEDTISQVMGKFTGNQSENPIKARTLLIPDEILYNNNFMAKGLMPKIANYSTYLQRRTHLKNVFNDVSIDGGIEPLLVELNAEHERFRQPFNDKKEKLQQELKDNPANKVKIDKQIKKLDKELVRFRKEFDTAKEQMNKIYEKMMGIRKLDRKADSNKSLIMSITAMANLPFVPFTMINDLSAIGLQHGIAPFIRDGIYPMVQSMFGILKTKDSEAFRATAPSVHLALQDVLMGYADRNWGAMTNPYLNLGKWATMAEKLAHASTNFTGTNYIDNGLQRITGSVVQSELMRILHAFKAGNMSKRDGMYIRKYGIDPDKWADRMIAAYEKNGGGKTKLGGYQSHFWQWEDMEAANEFSHSVFRSIKDTQIQAGLADAPMWTDDNGPLGLMGSVLKGFNGWMYASLNRYVIPSMQAPDAQKLLGIMFMLGTGSLVSPMRRMARGETPYPDNMSDKQWLYQTIQDSGYFSFFMTVLTDANLLTGDRLLGDLKNDKYRDRTMSGLLGPAWGTANRMKDIIGALASGEWNQADANKAARMIPIANASWTYWMSKKVVEGLGAKFDVPKTRAQAHALKEINR